MRRFGELEAVVMDRLWTIGGAGTVREVFDQLRPGREIAYTTVLSTMKNLERKGHLTRERRGKAHRYQTVTSPSEYSADLMRQALSGGADSDTVLTQFVGELTDEEFAWLQKVVAHHPRQR